MTGGATATLRPNLPDFGQQPPGNVVTLFGFDDTHALPFGNPAGRDVGRRLGNAQLFESQGIEPRVGHSAASFAHQALALLRQPEPEASIVLDRPTQFDRANDLFGLRLEADGPVPFVASLDGRYDLLVEGADSVGRVGPRNRSRREQAHDFPLREQLLSLLGVVKREGA